MPKTYSTICKSPTETLWAIDPARAESKWRTPAQAGAGEPQPKIAVIPIVGVIGKHRSDGFDTSTDDIAGALAAAVADKSVRSILLYVDSPGGTVTGVPELSDQIFAARDKKKIVAVVDSLAASAGYWLASAADKIVVPATGEVGSIGVFVMHMDFAGALEQAGIKPTFITAGKYKVEGNPLEPLTAEAKAYLQERVDALHGDFVKAVARNRGVPPATVREKFGQGRTVFGKEAVELGMADRIGSLSETLDRLGAAARNSALRAQLRMERVRERLK